MKFSRYPQFSNLLVVGFFSFSIWVNARMRHAARFSAFTLPFSECYLLYLYYPLCLLYFLIFSVFRLVLLVSFLVITQRQRMSPKLDDMLTT